MDCGQQPPRGRLLAMRRHGATNSPFASKADATDGDAHAPAASFLEGQRLQERAQLARNTRQALL
jgi:hypothetical protein